MAVSIELFGVEGYAHDVLRNRLEALLNAGGIQYRIHHIQEIDDFISEGLESVPAIRVNHKKWFRKSEHATVDEVAENVYEYILNHNVESIVCPVDFSEHSLHAAKWASELAADLGMHLVLMHVHIPVTEAQYVVPVDVAGTLHRLKDKLDQTATTLTSSDAEIGTPILTKLEVGDPIQQITYASREPTAGLVVLGTKGESNMIRQILGSVSIGVAHHAETPVILVPPQITYKRPEKILVAFHHELLSNGALRSLWNMTQSWQAHIQFVHVHEPGENFPALRDKLLERLTARELPGFSFDIQEIDAGDRPMIEALLEFAGRTKPDLLTLVTRQRGAVRRFLRPGMTRRLTLRTKWPLLILHEH